MTGPGRSRGLLTAETKFPGLHRPQDTFQEKKRSSAFSLWSQQCEQTRWPNRLTSLHSGRQSWLFAIDVKCHPKLVVLPRGKASPFPFPLQCFCFHSNISGSPLQNELIGSSGYSVVSGDLHLHNWSNSFRILIFTQCCVCLTVFQNKTFAALKYNISVFVLAYLLQNKLFCCN